MAVATIRPAEDNALRGRIIRRLEPCTQKEMFSLNGYEPSKEALMSLKEHCMAGAASASTLPRLWSPQRTAEYAFYMQDAGARFGPELLYVENRIRYRLLIPEVEVDFKGTKMSLRDVAGGVGIYPSIRLLKIEQSGAAENEEFLISPADPAGKVRAMDFMRSWAFPDEHGFPDAAYVAISGYPSARYGLLRGLFEKNSSGWHGSVVYESSIYGGRGVHAYANWTAVYPVSLISTAGPVSG
jgi:hypothetical protein